MTREQLLAATGVEGAQAPEIEALTVAFSNLAAIAIQAIHAVAGKAMTPENILALLPVNTPLGEGIKTGVVMGRRLP